MPTKTEIKWGRAAPGRVRGVINNITAKPCKAEKPAPVVSDELRIDPYF